MKEINLKVPEGIDYLSQWKELRRSLLPLDQHYILNKRICGCGATETYLQSEDRKVILASPRKSLLYNKYSQHLSDNYHLYRFLGDPKKYYEGKMYKSKTNGVLDYKANLCSYIKEGGRKILTTYDSLREIREMMENLGQNFDEWTVVVDEFQIIFYDSIFKDSTEHEFLSTLSGWKNVVYLSATPLLSKYLNMTELFRDFTIYNLEWPVGKLEIPNIKAIKTVRGIRTVCNELISKYRSGHGDIITLADGTDFVSSEVVIYINSVKDIAGIIKANKLSEDEVNIICSSTTKNINKLKNIKGFKHQIGDIPGKGEPHKMFTFCTSTVYVGADFYSTNAATYIFSNANVDCMTIDILNDLQQILGRQRLEENPFRNSATLYYSTTASLQTHEDYNAMVEKKSIWSDKILKSWENSKTAGYEEVALELTGNYLRKKDLEKERNNYCSLVRSQTGEVMLIDNDILRVADLRAWETSNLIYKNNFTMYSTLKKSSVVTTQFDSNIQEVQEIYDLWINFKTFKDKMKFYCEIMETRDPEIIENCQFLSNPFKEFYDSLGTEAMSSLEWRKDRFIKALKPMPFDEMPYDEISKRVIQEFREDKEYAKTNIKDILQSIYESLGIKNVQSKAIDLENYIECKETSISRGLRKGKTVACFKITSLLRKDVSLFKRITEPGKPDTYRVDKILEIIRDNTYFDLAKKVGAIRKESNKDKRGQLKRYLPAVCWNGTFRMKNKDSGETYSSFVALDFDHVEDMEGTKKWLSNDPCVYAVYTTPSGDGLKALICHDNSRPEYHDDLLTVLFKKFARPELDVSVRDFARAHYLSYDPDIYINPSPEAFHYVIDKSKASLPKGEGVVIYRDEVTGEDMYISDGTLDVDGFLGDLRTFLKTDDAVIRRFRRVWTGESIKLNGRNNTSMAYLGLLCKAGVEKEKAKDFVRSLIPGFDITEQSEYAYLNNDFGCSRRKK